MTVTYGFYDSLSGDRVYTALQLSSMFTGLISDGVFYGIGSNLVVRTDVGMQVAVQTGKAWFNNTWTLLDADQILTVDPADVALDRIDSVVIEIDTQPAVRANSFKIVKGTASGSPVPPTLTNNATTHQYKLCDISIVHGTASITGGMLTNKVGTIDCPFVGGVLANIPSKASAAQVDAGIDDFNYITAAAIKGSNNVPNAVPGADYNAVISLGGKWVSIPAMYRLNRVVYLWTPGAGTFTVNGFARALYVECIGGGGAGGGAAVSSGNLSLGAGGGAGAYSAKLIVAPLAASYSYTVGAAGVAVSGAAGGAGGDTLFGTAVKAKGGSGGTTMAANTTLGTQAGGLGGVAGSGLGDFLLDGADGGWGLRLSAAIGVSGAGGGAPLGGGLTGGKSVTSAGTAGGRYGGGGSGALTTAAAQIGGNGYAGVLRIYEYI